MKKKVSRRNGFLQKETQRKKVVNKATGEEIAPEVQKWIDEVSENPQWHQFRGQHRTKTKKEIMLLALVKTLGIVTPAAGMAGIAMKTHYEWLKDDESYAAAVEETLTMKKDFGEHALMTLIQKGDNAAAIFFNKTFNKDRGYAERRETVKSFQGTKNIRMYIPSNDHADEQPTDQGQVLPGNDVRADDAKADPSPQKTGT